MLTGKVDNLQREMESRLPPPKAQAASQPTALVFHDSHIQEVQNYAIVGTTLWVFDQQRATRIPLAQLDVPATVKLNDQRGVDFRLPQ